MYLYRKTVFFLSSLANTNVLTNVFEIKLPLKLKRTNNEQNSIWKPIVY